jgi:glycine/D-amino acid oxidase-like deaminating enzyme
MSEPIHNNDSSHSRSLWMEVPMPSFAPLQDNLNVDVCIIGSGIVGLTCAYTLTKQGKSVAIIDQSMIGSGQTTRTTAHLSWALDDRYYNLEKFFGQENSSLIAQSHAAAIDYIEKIIADENIDCDFQRVSGYLFAAPQDSQDILDRELADK